MLWYPPSVLLPLLLLVLLLLLLFYLLLLLLALLTLLFLPALYAAWFRVKRPAQPLESPAGTRQPHQPLPEMVPGSRA